MPNTSLGIFYPDAQASVNTWQHWQQQAETTDAAIQQRTNTGATVSLTYVQYYGAYTDTSFPTPNLVQKGDVVFLNGGLIMRTGTGASVSQLVAYTMTQPMAAALRPKRRVTAVGLIAASSRVACNIYVQTTGEIAYVSPSALTLTANSSYINVPPIFWFI